MEGVKGREPMDGVEAAAEDVERVTAAPEIEAGSGESGTKLQALILREAPSSSSMPRRSVTASIAMLTVPNLPLCCLAATRPVTRTRDPT